MRQIVLTPTAPAIDLYDVDWFLIDQTNCGVNIIPELNATETFGPLFCGAIPVVWSKLRVSLVYPATANSAVLYVPESRLDPMPSTGIKKTGDGSQSVRESGFSNNSFYEKVCTLLVAENILVPSFFDDRETVICNNGPNPILLAANPAPLLATPNECMPVGAGVSYRTKTKGILWGLATVADQVSGAALNIVVES